MENEEKLDPSVYLDVLGQRKKLEYSFHAIKQFKRLTGKSLFKGFDYSNLEEDDFSALVWAGLIKHDPSLDGDVEGLGKPSEHVQEKLKEIDKSLDYQRMIEIMTLITKALGAAQPDPKAENTSPGKKDGARENGISSSSGQSQESISDSPTKSSGN